MSATPCPRFVDPSISLDVTRCWACGGSRAEHEGRAEPTTGARLPTPEAMARTELGDDAVDALLGLDGRHMSPRAAAALDALRAELRGGS